MMLKGDRGQALVELAFVIPIVLLFLFAIIDFGLALNDANSDTNLANVAARSVSTLGATKGETCTLSNGTAAASDLYDWVSCIASTSGDPTPTSVCILDLNNSSLSASQVGDPIKIEVASAFQWTGLLGNFAKGLTTTLGGSATMRLEQPLVSGTTLNTFFSGAKQCAS